MLRAGENRVRIESAVAGATVYSAEDGQDGTQPLRIHDMWGCMAYTREYALFGNYMYTRRAFI